MKINISYLRLGLLIVNLVCVVSLPAYAYFRYKASIDNPRLNIVDPALFDYKEGELAGETGKGEARIVGAAGGLQPMPPAPIAEASLGTKTPEPEAETAAGPGDLEPGPLDKDWEYYSGIFFADHPLLNRVFLRRKDPAAGGLPTGVPGSSRSTLRPRPTLRPTRINPAKKGGGLPQQSGDTIALVVGEREYVNKELDLHIRIHSGDPEHLVYSLANEFREGQPPIKYALKRVVEVRYIENPEEGLRPATPPEAAAAEGGEAEKEKPKFIKRTKEFDKTKEEDFARYEKGEQPLSTESFGPPTAASPSKRAAAETSGAAAAPETKKASVPSFKRGSAAIDRRGPTEDERKQLKDALKNVPAEDKRKIQEALMGAPK